MPDLHISITWMGDTRTGASLFASAGPHVPGWYLRAYKNDGYTDVVKYTPISPEMVEELARRIDLALGTSLRPTVQRENAQADKWRNERINHLRARIDADRFALEELERQRIALTNELSPAKMDSSTATKEA